MKILIVSATEFEISNALPSILSYNCDYLVTGVGMVATAFGLGKHLQHQSYDLLLNVGIAGTFNLDHNIGDIYKIKTDQIFQFGAENKGEFLPIEQLGFGTSYFHEQLPIIDLGNSFYNIPYIEAITVNKVHGNKSTIETIRGNYGKDLLESMEGAAFFYAANTLKIPAIQIRAISNYVEDRNTENWNIPKALSNLNSWIEEFLKECAGKGK